MKRTGMTLTALLIVLAASGCGDESTKPEAPTTPAYPTEARQELEHAKASTQKYYNLDAALADGYVDINVVKPMMGRHYMKQSLLDATFEVEKPEILVYNTTTGDTSDIHLVAVEYAIPLSVRNDAPEGFKGTSDVWDPNQTFQLWLLHAWVFEENPDGVFSPMNHHLP